MVEIKAPRGTNDILPSETEKWDYLFSVARNIFERYGYRRIETPLFEETSLFSRAIGEGTDIVQKEMYSFKDKAGRDLTLRPEETASVVRAYIEHGLYHGSALTKLYYWGPMFRYERPQRGRSRQFFQLGVEALGSADPALDAEVIELLVKYLRKVKVSDLKLYLNSVGDRVCRSSYVKVLRRYLDKNLEVFCADCQRRASLNPMRVFDCKVKRCQQQVKKAPLISDYLCADCQDHFAQVRDILTQLNIPFTFDPHLVRGLDYYTRTTFEIKSSHLGAQDAVGAGGRYDYLVEQYGGPPTPAIGFAIGMERLMLALEKQGVSFPKGKVLDVFIVTVDKGSSLPALKLLSALRDEGFFVDKDYGNRSLKSQMRLADRLGVTYTIIFGEEELREGVLTIRHMESGQQYKIKRREIVQWLRKRI